MQIQIPTEQGGWQNVEPCAELARLTDDLFLHRDLKSMERLIRAWRGWAGGGDYTGTENRKRLLELLDVTAREHGIKKALAILPDVKAIPPARADEIWGSV